MYSVFIDGLRAPVTPGKLTTKIKNKNKTVTLLSGDEFNILKSPGLTEVEIDLMIPSVLYPFARYDGGFKPQDFYLTRFETLKASKKPFQFTVSRVRPNVDLMYETNMLVSLEDYSIIEDAGDGTDLMLKIKLKHYRPQITKRVVLTTLTVVKVSSTTRPAKTPAKTYTVKRGDTLWTICRKELGDGSRYPEIAKLNKIVNPNLIYVGQVIKFE